MKKTNKRFAALIAAMALSATMAIPAGSMITVNAAATANTISFTGETTGTHTYTAYRIFNGSASGNGFGGSASLGNPTWAGNASGTGTLSDFIAALQANTAFGAVGSNDFDATTDVAGIITVLNSYANNSDKAKAFAKLCAENASTYGFTSTAGTAGGNISVSTDGYYVVAETGTASDSAKTAYLLGVYDASAGAEITVKSAMPTVDKQVQDEAADKDVNSTDADGWGETADHAINESFQYKLTATLAADPDYAAYNTYRLKFNDTLNAGVTYDGIVSVKVKSAGKDDVAVPVYNSSSATSGYLVTQPSSGDYNLTIMIGDIKQYLPTGAVLGTDVITVEVIYNAHLNENATVRNASDDAVATSDPNVNKVNLQYSNNPNVTGSGDSGDTPGSGGNEEEFGQTPDDYVWVFTYEVDNTKYKNSAVAGNELAGAGFRLYDSTGTTEIGLIYDSTISAYRPVASGETAEEMTSAASTGVFNIKGLDAGTYVLKETTTPSGYNTCADITITVNPTHAENSGGATANLTWTDSGNDANVSNVNNSIINSEGSTLPSTGGLGTTLFVLGGGCAAGLAGIYLISRKRTKKEDEE